VKIFLLSLTAALSMQASVHPAVPFGKLPLRFEENIGQAPSTVRYVARGTKFQFFLEPMGNTIRWPGGSLETRLIGADPEAQVSGADVLGATTNYFQGNQPGAWKTGIHSYGRVKYSSVYPGVDMMFHGREGLLEYDFLVHPGADPKAIEWRLNGADEVRVDDAGDLVVSTLRGEIRWKKPEIYQGDANQRISVEGRFALRGENRVSFEIGAYDRSRDLVIDPVLAFSTFMGGTGQDGTSHVAVDASGNVYVTGATTSQDLAVSRTAFQPAYAGAGVGVVASAFVGDVIVAKFTSTGTLVYLTYLGGSKDEAATAIAVDSAGNAYVCGYTNSTDFPKAGTPVQAAFGGFGGNPFLQFGDGFIAKLGPNGDKLLYSTYLGGSSDDMAVALTLDSSANMYVVGWTLSKNFPTTAGTYQSPLRGAGGQPATDHFGVPLITTGDVFVVKISADGTKIVFSSIIGGTMDDTPSSIALDSSGNVYFAGATLSNDFPVTPQAYQKTNRGSDTFTNFFANMGDGFVGKLSADGQTLVYATYLGGSGDDGISSLAVGPDGSAYVTGSTESSDFPVTIFLSFRGPDSAACDVDYVFGDAFVTRLKPDGSGLILSRFLGGTADDGGTGIALDGAGNIFVAGGTASTDFPVTSDAFQPMFGGSGPGLDPWPPKGDGFLTMFDPTGATILYSTFLGGSLADYISGLALDNAGNAYLTGYTLSANFPVTAGAFQKNHILTQDNGDSTPTSEEQMDAFITKMSGLTTGPFVSAVVNAASNAQGQVSPGMIVVMYGGLIGPTVTSPVLAAIDPTTGLLSSNRSSTQFLFDNIPAPIVYVSASQSAAIVPYQVAGAASTQLVAMYNGQQSPPVTLTVTNTSPGLFSLNFSGSGQGAIFNQDNTPNSSQNPAHVGTVIQVYGTGEGLLNPPAVTGQIAPTAPPFPTPAANVSATIGGATASILYKGPVPGDVVGLFQINLTVPAGVPTGNQPVVIQVGSNKSQANLTVAVQ
jgi:uncharacterized protein (TIGR03437 family)